MKRVVFWAVPQGQMHLWADRAVFEVYRPDRADTVPEGVGQLVVTPLYRAAMPLLRYNLEDSVEVSYRDCPCGWRLPTVRVLGRSAFGHQVGDARVTQAKLEELVFSLPIEYEVMFWRAKAQPDRLTVEVEVAPRHAADAVAQLASSVRAEYGVRPEVVAASPGALVPESVLTGVHDVVKPRSLFGPDEDWDKALLYY